MEPANAVPCIGCHTDCCSHYVVPLNAHDIHRLATALDVPPSSFVELHSWREPPRSVDLWDGHYEVVLRKRPGDDCVFLLSLDGSRRCAVQAFKPRSCAIYPFTMDEAGDLWHRADMLCPRPWDLDPAAMARTKADIVQMRTEWGFYEGLVVRWNERRQPGAGVTEYLDFLMASVSEK